MIFMKITNAEGDIFLVTKRKTATTKNTNLNILRKRVSEKQKLKEFLLNQFGFNMTTCSRDFMKKL